MKSQVSRRTFLGASGLVLTGAALSRYSLAAEGQLYAYVGRSTPGFAGAATGGGIDIFRVNMADGSMQPVGTTGPEVQDLNCDAMCTSADGRFLYAVNRTTGLGGVPGMGGGVVAFAINRADGTLKYLNTQPSMGAMPVGVRIDKTNSRVIVGNHGAVSRAVRIEKRNGKPVIERPTDDGTVAIYPVGPDGSLGAALDVAVLDREPAKDYKNPRPVVLGPTAGNQIGAAVHQVTFDQTQRWIIASDNGYDRIYVYPFSPTSKTLKGKWFQVTVGSAPRHFAVHPSAPYFFITNEREPSASSFHFNSKTGDVQHVQTIATVVDGQPAPPPAADGTQRRISPSDIRIHPTGRFVYSSNRVPGGPDTIAVFAVDASSGRLTRVEVVETGGGGQREINIDPSGRFLFSCNTASNDVTVLAIDAATGKLTRTAKATVQRPMVIDFAVL
ncbi:MAG: beta-propeller fold lactonase family protein [Steroidobacteraceae bacterium]